MRTASMMSSEEITFETVKQLRMERAELLYALRELETAVSESISCKSIGDIDPMTVQYENMVYDADKENFVHALTIARRTLNKLGK